MIGSRNSTPLHSRATFVLLRKVVEKLLFRKGSLAWLLVKYAFVFYASFFFLSESGRSRTAVEWRRGGGGGAQWFQISKTCQE